MLVDIPANCGNSVPFVTCFHIRKLLFLNLCLCYDDELLISYFHVKQSSSQRTH